ncbi:MAG: lipoprotein insertase outer membrane protein LolB, partial [Pseudomonadota bacterium]
RVPLARLPRWVRGLPDTSLDEVSGNDYRLDEHGRLARFSDQQWTVEYDRYESRGDSPALPHFIEMRNDEVRIRLVIDRWNLEAGE